MSILIKGMEMPKNCFDCPCYHHKVDDGYYDYEICGASGTVFNDGYSSVTGHKDHIVPFKERLDNCPLVPVPPHGPLVDTLDVINAFPDGYVFTNEQARALTNYIIPAEEGER